MFLPNLDKFLQKNKVAVQYCGTRNVHDVSQIVEPENYVMTVVVGKTIGVFITVKNLADKKDLSIRCGTMNNVNESFRIAAKLFDREGVDKDFLDKLAFASSEMKKGRQALCVSLSCYHLKDAGKETFLLNGLGVNDTFLDSNSAVERVKDICKPRIMKQLASSKHNEKERLK